MSKKIERFEDAKTDKEFVENINKYSCHVVFDECNDPRDIVKWGFSFPDQEYSEAVHDGAYWCDGSYSLECAIAEYLTFSYKQLAVKSQRIRELEAQLALSKLSNSEN
jgi:hypothetical protein